LRIIKTKRRENRILKYCSQVEFSTSIFYWFVPNTVNGGSLKFMQVFSAINFISYKVSPIINQNKNNISCSIYEKGFSGWCFQVSTNITSPG